MRFLRFLVIGLLAAHAALAQGTGNEQLVELARAYKNFMFRTEPPKNFAGSQVAAGLPALQGAARFIAQTITTNNKLLDKQYLILPDEQTLTSLYAIRLLNYNLRKENAVDNNKLLDSLKATPTDRNHLIDNYYDMLFTAVGNKNRPFNLARYDFTPGQYGLRTDTERGIFFLQCMNLCGTAIWGYMNIVKPPNTQEAYAYIKRYPHFNGQPYYQYMDLNFPDFQQTIDQARGPESYKGYYLNKYYNTLLYHFVCLHEQHASEKDITNLILSSILRDRSLYKYSTKRDVLEKMLAEQEP